MRKFTVIILLLCALISFDSQASGGALDVSGTLARPGVKLVAVEFFATWCKPCMESVPKWKALHEKYRAKGLRLIVVSVGEDGMCTNPGWNPDQTVCDLEGTIQQSMGAMKLPQAFLWSWQGNLLASHASFETVERAIENYFRETPRILISNPTDKANKPVKDAAAIREMIRSELRKQAKFDLVASGEDRRILRKLAKKGYDPRYDDSLQCEIGQEVSPNSELKVKLISWGKNKQTLLLQLYSIEKGCMVASAKTRVEGDMERAIYDAVLQLVRQLMGKASGAARGGQDMPPGGTTAVVEPPQDTGELSFDQLMQRAEKLKAEQAQLEVARQKRMKKLEADWQKVQKIALETALPQKDRIKFIRQFLATYDSDNPHKDDAIKLIKDILEGTINTAGLEFYKLEKEFETYLAYKIEVNNNQLPHSKWNTQLARKMDEKSNMMKTLQKKYTAIVENSGSPFWAVASLCRIGQVLENYSDTIMHSESPYWLDRGQTVYYSDALIQRAEPIDEKAYGFYKKCIKMAEKHNITSEYVTMARQKLANLRQFNSVF